MLTYEAIDVTYMGYSSATRLKRFVWLTAGTFIEILIKIRQKGVEGYGTKREIKPEIQGAMRRDSILVIFSQLAGWGWGGGYWICKFYGRAFYWNHWGRLVGLGLR